MAYKLGKTNRLSREDTASSCEYPSRVKMRVTPHYHVGDVVAMKSTNLIKVEGGFFRRIDTLHPIFVAQPWSIFPVYKWQCGQS